MRGGSGGDAHKQPLVSGERPARRKSVLVFDGDDLVVDRSVERIGHKARADALQLMRSGYALGKHGRTGRLDGDDADLRILAFQIRARAADGAARADARDENVHFSVRILPDFGACGAFVRGGIGGFGKLPGDKAVRPGGSQLIRLFNGALHPLGALGKNKLRAVGPQQVAAFHAHCIRHGQDDFVASRGGDRRESDAGVPARRFDDD